MTDRSNPLRDLLARVSEHIEATKGACKSKRLKEARELIEQALERYAGDRDELDALSTQIGRELDGRFSLAEIMALVDVLNGVWMGSAFGGDWIFRFHPSAIALEVHDGCRLNGLDAKWEIDGAALTAKLLALLPHQVWWLTWNVEQVWRDGSTTIDHEAIRRQFRCAPP